MSASHERWPVCFSSILSKMMQIVPSVIFWNFAISFVLTDGLIVNLTKCYSFVGWRTPETEHYIHTRDKLQCLLSCLFDIPFCSGIYFNENTKICRRLKETRVLLFRATIDDVFIVTPHMKALHCEGTSKYSYNFQEASDICQNFRGQLVTESGLQDIFNQGIDYCRCGWVQNGKQGFANQGTRTECGQTPGVIMCNQTLANAWCNVTNQP